MEEKQQQGNIDIKNTWPLIATNDAWLDSGLENKTNNYKAILLNTWSPEPDSSLEIQNLRPQPRHTESDAISLDLWVIPMNIKFWEALR